MAARKRTITVNDKMQRGYRYALAAPAGRNFDPDFTPDLTPREMLALGVFCGKYLTDCRKEFPRSWFTRAKLSPKGRMGTAPLEPCPLSGQAPLETHLISTDRC